MKKKKLEFKKNSNLDNSLKDFMFYINYNENISKNKFKNSLNSMKIDYYDNLLETSIPKEAQIAQRMYSEESDIFNDFYRLSKEKFNKKLMELELTTDEVEVYINNLKKSEIILKKDIVVYRGFTVFNINPNKLKETHGFISTSVDKAIAVGYTQGIGKVIPVQIPKETKIMYLRKHSIYPNHMEVLIPPEYYIHGYKVKNQVKYIIRKRK